MTRYTATFLIVFLTLPSMAQAATLSPSTQQKIQEIEKTLKVLLILYKEALAAEQKKTAALGESASRQFTKRVYSTPVILSEAAELEKMVLKVSNDTRRAHGLAPLSHDSALATLARLHSSDMLEHNYFSHKNASGCNSTCRMTESGYAWEKMGENIHMMSGYNYSVEESAKKIVRDWMNSPSHRANLLNPKFTHVGLGVAQKGDTYYTAAEYSLPY